LVRPRSRSPLESPRSFHLKSQALYRGEADAQALFLSPYPAPIKVGFYSADAGLAVASDFFVLKNFHPSPIEQLSQDGPLVATKNQQGRTVKAPKQVSSTAWTLCSNKCPQGRLTE